MCVCILQGVINVSKKFLPGMAVGYSSPKLTLHVGDGFQFMKQNQDAFDVIITDSSDPVGKMLKLTLKFLFKSAKCFNFRRSIWVYSNENYIRQYTTLSFKYADSDG